MDMLNQAQKTSLTIALRITEMFLDEIEHLITKDNADSHIMYKYTDLPSSESRDKIINDINKCRVIIKKIKDEFQCETEIMSIPKVVGGRLSYLWEVFEDTKSDKLKRYGDVDPALKNKLDPLLTNLMELLSKLMKVSE
jgi:hypothetical protein